MILYAKSSLELIVNNRIGKVGIRPDGRPPSTPHHQRCHPPLYPRNYPLTVSLPSQRISFSTGVSALQICCPSVRLSLYPSVRPSVRSCRSTVRAYVSTYVPTRTCQRAISVRNINAYMYTRLHTRICINARPVPARTALPTYVLLRINA